MKTKTLLVSSFLISMLLSSAAALASSRICAGQIVYANNGNDLVGQVTNVFGNKAEIRWQLLNGAPYSGELSYWNVDQLSVQTRCFQDVCQGSTVYGNNGHDLVGTVSRVFENGKTEMKWSLLDGRAIAEARVYWRASKLSLQTSCYGAICTNDRVYGNNGNDLVGIVQRVFSNGKVEVNWMIVNGAAYSGISYWRASKLQKMSDPCGDGTCR